MSNFKLSLGIAGGEELGRSFPNNRNLDFKPFREFSRNSISVSISQNIST
jgi:hypothetical protein